MNAYQIKMEAIKASKIEELIADIEILKTLKDGDPMPGHGRPFVSRRLPGYLDTASRNLRVAKKTPADVFSSWEGEHIIFTYQFCE